MKIAQFRFYVSSGVKGVPMEKFLTFIFLLFLLLSCGNGLKNLDRGKSKILLSNVTIYDGYNSEAVAIMNAMRYLGYDIDEPLICGGGGIIDFAFHESAFPFIGTKNERMAEVFFEGVGIEWSGKINTGSKKSWKLIKEKLEEGLPVILRVDVRYLPYRFGGKHGSRFSSYGMHYVTIFGLDFEKRKAFISDVGYTNLLEISFDDIDKARYSFTQAFPPYGEFYWIEREKKDFNLNLKRLLTNSFKAIIKNYEKPKKQDLTDLRKFYGIEGLENLSKEIVNIEKLVTGVFLPSVFYGFWYYLEKLETKGSANRQIFKEFLVDINKKVKDRRIENMIVQLSLCIDNWKTLSAEFYSISKSIGNKKEKYERKAFYDRAGAIADQLAREERLFYQLIKEYIEAKKN